MTQKHIITWETIDGTTTRLKVIGGWIVKNTITNTNWVHGTGNQSKSTMGLVFVPDYHHQWVISTDEFRNRISIFEEEQ